MKAVVGATIFSAAVTIPVALLMICGKMLHPLIVYYAVLAYIFLYITGLIYLLQKEKKKILCITTATVMIAVLKPESVFFITIPFAIAGSYAVISSAVRKRV